MLTLFHPQTDGASTHAIWSIAQILRATVCSDQSDWTEKLPITEFTLNSAISGSFRFTPFELTYGYMPSMNPGLTPEPNTAPGVKKFVAQVLQNLTDTYDTIIESHMNQTYQANHH